MIKKFVCSCGAEDYVDPFLTIGEYSHSRGVKRTTLPNGITISTVEFPHFSFGAWETLVFERDIAGKLHILDQGFEWSQEDALKTHEVFVDKYDKER